VIETTARSILEEGLAYDRCLVGVVTDMDGFEPWPITTCWSRPDAPRDAHPDRRGAGRRRGVLNADLPEVADLAELCDGEVVLYATRPTTLSPPTAPTPKPARRRPPSSQGQQWCWPPARRNACWARSTRCACPRPSARHLRPAGGHCHRLGAGHHARADRRRHQDLEYQA
jgi:hypothetical protein